MIPDKIYIYIGPHLGLMQANKIPVGAPGEEQYIRKDAILEWAKGQMTEEETEEGVILGYNIALKELINHIESL